MKLTMIALLITQISASYAYACMSAPFDVEFNNVSVATLKGASLVSDGWEESQESHASDLEDYEMKVYYTPNHEMSLRLYESFDVQPGTIWKLYSLSSAGKKLERSYEIRRVRSMRRNATLTSLDSDGTRFSVGCH